MRQRPAAAAGRRRGPPTPAQRAWIRRWQWKEGQRREKKGVAALPVPPASSPSPREKKRAKFTKSMTDCDLRNLNRHFRDVKDIHKKETLVIFAPGPSLNEYDESEMFYKDVIRLGVNGTILHPRIRDSLDYFVWASDIDIPRHRQPQFLPVKKATSLLNPKTKRYINCWTDGSIIHPIWGCQTQMHPDDVKALEGDWKMYNQSTNNNLLTKDLEDGVNHFTVIMQALNIALHMGFTRIVLVGVDAGGGHSYRGMVEGDKCDWGEVGASHSLVQTWSRAKDWVAENYPDVEILSYNPRNLKGLFKELKPVTNLDVK